MSLPYSAVSQVVLRNGRKPVGRRWMKTITKPKFRSVQGSSFFYLRQSQQVNKWSNLRFLLVLLLDKFLIWGHRAMITIRAIIDGVPDFSSDHCDHLWPDVTRCDQCNQISNAAKSIILEVNYHVFDHCDHQWPLVTLYDHLWPFVTNLTRSHREP